MNPEFIYSSFLRWERLIVSEDSAGKTQNWGDLLVVKVVPSNIVPGPG